jgi:hypothetical protein
MANSMASILIKPTISFNRGDTFVFSSWVCTVDGAGSFQRRLTMTPNPKTGLVTLPEVITSTLTGKFGEIWLYNQHADFEFGSVSNSNSTSPWVIACEPATEPSCEIVPPHEHFPYHLCNASRTHAEALVARWVGKEIVPDYSSDSNPASGYSSYEFDFGLDPVELESEITTTEEPLLGSATGLVITSTPAGRFVYWPDRKPVDLTVGNSHCVAYLDSLPFQEGTPLAPTEEHTSTEVATTDSDLGTPDRQVFMAAGEIPGPSGTRPDRYFDDISEDELSANAPADETTDDKNTQRDRNRKQNKRRRRLRKTLPIRNLTEALDQVADRVHTTPEQFLMSITTTTCRAQGVRAGEVIAKLAEDAYFMRVDNRVIQVPLSELMNPDTMKLPAAVQQTVDATAPAENNHTIPTAPGPQLEDPLKAATTRAASAVAAAALVGAMAAAGVAVAGAHHTTLVEELVAAAIAEAESTRTATSLATHVAATMPATKLKRFVAKRLL